MTALAETDPILPHLLRWPTGCALQRRMATSPASRSAHRRGALRCRADRRRLGDRGRGYGARRAAPGRRDLSPARSPDAIRWPAPARGAYDDAVRTEARPRRQSQRRRLLLRTPPRPAGRSRAIRIVDFGGAVAGLGHAAPRRHGRRGDQGRSGAPGLLDGQPHGDGGESPASAGSASTPRRPTARPLARRLVEGADVVMLKPAPPQAAHKLGFDYETLLHGSTRG